MDTLISMRANYFANITEKALVWAVMASIVCIPATVSSEIISVDDMRIAHYSAPAVDLDDLKQKILTEISPEVRKQNFDNKIQQKYPNAIINDVTDGVKHVNLIDFIAEGRDLI